MHRICKKYLPRAPTQVFMGGRLIKMVLKFIFE